MPKTVSFNSSIPVNELLPWKEMNSNVAKDVLLPFSVQK
jgi:hypothetical protein